MNIFENTLPIKENYVVFIVLNRKSQAINFTTHCALKPS